MRRHCRTSQVEEVGLLVELVEDCARAELRVCCGEHGDAVLGKLAGERGSAVMVLQGGDARCYYSDISEPLSPIQKAHSIRSPALTICGCVSCSGCPNCISAAETNPLLAQHGCRKAGLLRNFGTGRDAARNEGNTLLFMAMIRRNRTSLARMRSLDLFRAGRLRPHILQLPDPNHGDCATGNLQVSFSCHSRQAKR